MAGLRVLVARPLGRFVLVGLSNTLVGLLVIFGCKALLGITDVAANLIGYTLLIGLSFALNRRWTFEDGGHKGKSLVRFLLVLAVAYAANLATALAAIGLGVDNYLAHVLGIGPYTVIGYLGSRLFVFTSPRVHAPLRGVGGGRRFGQPRRRGPTGARRARTKPPVAPIPADPARPG